jgi:hypothetical protein
MRSTAAWLKVGESGDGEGVGEGTGVENGVWERVGKGFVGIGRPIQETIKDMQHKSDSK